MIYTERLVAIVYISSLPDHVEGKLRHLPHLLFKGHPRHDAIDLTFDARVQGDSVRPFHPTTASYEQHGQENKQADFLHLIDMIIFYISVHEGFDVSSYRAQLFAR